MNLILSDRPLAVATEDFREETKIIDLSSRKIAGCMGCFGCWVKTPGKCVIRDDAVEVYPLIARSDRVLYVSRVRYGSYDTVMKTMLERAIPIQKAYIRLHRGETHHVQRDVAMKKAVIIGYGDLDEDEKQVFRKLVERNASNMNFESWQVRFARERDVEEAVRREVETWKKS